MDIAELILAGGDKKFLMYQRIHRVDSRLSKAMAMLDHMPEFRIQEGTSRDNARRIVSDL